MWGDRKSMREWHVRSKSRKSIYKDEKKERLESRALGQHRAMDSVCHC